MQRLRLLHKEYASFRPDIVKYFVTEVLPNSKTILDPMAGTSQLIPYVEYLGLTAYFNDILPLFFYVNRAKTFKTCRTILTLQKRNSQFLGRELRKCLVKLEKKRLIISEKWIHDDVLEGLLHAWQKSNDYEENLGHFLKAIIILCVRSYTSTSPSPKNTTWYKPGGMTSGKKLIEVIKEQIEKIFSYYNNYYPDIENIKGGDCQFLIKDASSLNLKKEIDTILTSPAYANRYDYTVMYAPELYFLYKADPQIDPPNLKKTILASNSVEDYSTLENDLDILSKKAPKTRAFLSEVEKRGLKRENKYYLRYFCKYYSNLYNIFDNLLSLLSARGAIYIVVQNNIHRGELNSMDEFMTEYFSMQGLKVENVFNKLRMHQGRRNISADYPIVLKKHMETIIRVQK